MSEQYMLNCPYYPKQCRKYPDECQRCEDEAMKDAEPQPTTNGDKIRAMSDEELAKTVSQTGCGLCTALGIRELCRINNDMACEEIIWKWLQQPAEEETT